MIPTNTQLKRFFQGEVSTVLSEYVRAGPLDGGCLIVAKAFIRAFGRGELIRIVVTIETTEFTDHYGALIDGEIYDGSGKHRSPEAWLNHHKLTERPKHELRLEHGYEWQAAPWNWIEDIPSAVRKVADLMERELFNGAKTNGEEINSNTALEDRQQDSPSWVSGPRLSY